eukprot:gene3511-biopygen564
MKTPKKGLTAGGDATARSQRAPSVAGTEVEGAREGERQPTCGVTLLIPAQEREVICFRGGAEALPTPMLSAPPPDSGDGAERLDRWFPARYVGAGALAQRRGREGVEEPPRRALHRRVAERGEDRVPLPVPEPRPEHLRHLLAVRAQGAGAEVERRRVVRQRGVRVRDAADNCGAHRVAERVGVRRRREEELGGHVDAEVVRPLRVARDGRQHLPRLQRAGPREGVDVGRAGGGDAQPPPLRAQRTQDARHRRPAAQIPPVRAERLAARPGPRPALAEPAAPREAEEPRARAGVGLLVEAAEGEEGEVAPPVAVGREVDDVLRLEQPARRGARVVAGVEVEAVRQREGRPARGDLRLRGGRGDGEGDEGVRVRPPAAVQHPVQEALRELEREGAAQRVVGGGGPGPGRPRHRVELAEGGELGVELGAHRVVVRPPLRVLQLGEELRGARPPAAQHLLAPRPHRAPRLLPAVRALDEHRRLVLVPRGRHVAAHAPPLRRRAPRRADVVEALGPPARSPAPAPRRQSGNDLQWVADDTPCRAVLDPRRRLLLAGPPVLRLRRVGGAALRVARRLMLVLGE